MTGGNFYKPTLISLEHLRALMVQSQAQFQALYWKIMFWSVPVDLNQQNPMIKVNVDSHPRAILWGGRKSIDNVHNHITSYEHGTISNFTASHTSHSNNFILTKRSLNLM